MRPTEHTGHAVESSGSGGPQCRLEGMTVTAFDTLSKERIILVEEGTIYSSDNL